ncbi:MAG: HAD family hydrolase [Acidobacteriota bacterium]
MSTGAGRCHVLLFDFGGTLDADGVAWNDRFYDVWREEVGDGQRERFDQAFYAADAALVGAVPADLPLTETIRRLARGIGRELLAGGAAAERAGSRFASDSLHTLARRAPLLALLASRYRLGIVSNFYGNLAAACQEAGIGRYFAAAVDSVDVGWVKPDARIFRAALDQLGAFPGEAVFVGDSPMRDMAGARAIGMSHVLLRPASGEPPVLCCPGDRAIATLEQLPEALA